MAERVSEYTADKLLGNIVCSKKNARTYVYIAGKVAECVCRQNVSVYIGEYLDSCWGLHKTVCPNTHYVKHQIISRQVYGNTSEYRSNIKPEYMSDNVGVTVYHR